MYDLSNTLRFFAVSFITLVLSLFILVSMPMAEVNVTLIDFINNPSFADQFFQIPYAYNSLNITGNILSQNPGHIYSYLNNNTIPYSNFFTPLNQTGTISGSGISASGKKDSLLNTINYYNHYLQNLNTNSTFSRISQSLFQQHFLIPNSMAPFYSGGDTPFNSLSYLGLDNTLYFNFLPFGYLNPWRSQSGNIVNSQNQQPEPEPSYHLFEDLKIFNMGALYASSNEPYRYLFVAEYSVNYTDAKSRYGYHRKYPSIFDLLADPDSFIRIQNQNVSDPVVKYWIDLGADPALFGRNDPNMAALFGKDEFTVDISLPIFADPKLRITKNGTGPPAQFFQDQGALEWEITIEGGDPNEMQNFTLQPLPVDFDDGMPTYLPVDHAASDAIKNFGKPYFQTDRVRMLEAALRNIGVTVWPNIVALDYRPRSSQTENTQKISPSSIKNLNITLRVSNQKDSDEMSFPFIVKNQPVDNHPPVLNLDFDYYYDSSDATEYIIKFIDPDCFIFSLSENPPTDHLSGKPISMDFRKDMDEIVWSVEKIIAPASDDWLQILPGPIFHFNEGYGDIWCIGELAPSESEHISNLILTGDDGRGGIVSFETFALSCNYQYWTWNHPPFLYRNYPDYIKVRSNEEYTLLFDVEDPDGDDLYAVCNIGTIESSPDGPFIWRFTSRASSASYQVKVFFFDCSRGYALASFDLEVIP